MNLQINTLDYVRQKPTRHCQQLTASKPIIYSSHTPEGVPEHHRARPKIK